MSGRLQPRLMGHRVAGEGPWRVAIGSTWCPTLRMTLIKLECGHCTIRSSKFCRGSHCELCMVEGSGVDSRPLWQRALEKRGYH